LEKIVVKSERRRNEEVGVTEQRALVAKGEKSSRDEEK